MIAHLNPQVRRDIDLIWQNCQDFNGATSWLGDHAETLRQFTQKKFAQAAIPDSAPISYTASGSQSPGRQRKSAPLPPVGRPLPPSRPVPPVNRTSSNASAITTDDVEMTLGQCRSLLKPFLIMPSANPFLVPVDPVLLNIPDYPTVVKHPMDLGTIEEKLNKNQYSSAGGFVRDMRLVWSNAILYNPAGTPVHLAAVALSEEFEKRLARIIGDVFDPSAAPLRKTPPAPSASSRAPPPAPPRAAPPSLPVAPPSAAPSSTVAPTAPSAITSAPVKRTPRPPAPRSLPAATYLPAATPGETSGAQRIRAVYRKAVYALRNHHLAGPFKWPVNWKKLGLFE